MENSALFIKGKKEVSTTTRQLFKTLMLDCLNLVRVQFALLNIELM